MNFSYIDEGHGKVLVFVHSYLWDKEMWRPQIDFLKKDYRCISIDLPAHGNSGVFADNEEVTLKSIAEDIVKFLEKLNIKEYTYIGLSVGGMLSTHIYNLDKEKIEKLIIMDSYLGSEPEETQKLYFSLLDAINITKNIPAHMADKIAPMFFTQQTAENKTPLYMNFYNSLINIPSEKITSIVKMGKAIFGRENTLDDLKKIDIPVFFITGEFDFPRPFSEAKEMSEYAAHSGLFKVENAGHISNLDNAKFVNKIFSEIFKL